MMRQWCVARGKSSNVNAEKPFIGLVLALAPRYSETFLTAKVQGLRDNGYEVAVFVGSGEGGPGIYRALGIAKSTPVRSVVMSGFAWTMLLLRRPGRVWRFIRSERALGRGPVEIAQRMAAYYHVLMHARSGWLHFGFTALAVGAESLASAIGSRMGVSLRGYDIAMYPLKHPGSLADLWSKVDKVHTISDDLTLTARRHGMPASIPVVKITPAVDLEFFQRRTPHVAKEGALRIVTVSRLHWKKGIEYVLMALKELSVAKPNIAWTYKIVGDGAELERLAFAAAEMGLSDRVSFSGKQKQEAVRELYEQADCCVQYSVQEGFCNAVLEAQAMELPCIVSDAEGLPENVGENGVVVPRRQPEMLANALAAVAVLPVDVRKEKTLAARKRLEAKFNVERQREAFAEFFKINRGVR